MFAQVMQGRLRDIEAGGAQFDAWDRDLKAGATGYLGATSGVSDDGEFVAVIRFESAEAAQANSDRPEQGAWWAATAPLFDGDVAFHDCPQADLFLGGGSDDAGFVQVIQSHGDRDQLQAMGATLEEHLRRTRPDVIGGIVAWHGDSDGDFTQLVYFTSEAAARSNEGAEASAEDAAIAEQVAHMLDGARFVDLRRIWFSSP